MATAGPGPSTTAQSALLLPGQPLPSNITKDPKPFIGAGCYEYGGKVLASVIGRPRRDGAVGHPLNFEVIPDGKLMMVDGQCGWKGGYGTGAGYRVYSKLSSAECRQGARIGLGG
jgi:exosome complex component CSL4